MPYRSVSQGAGISLVVAFGGTVRRLPPFPERTTT